MDFITHFAQVNADPNLFNTPTTTDSSAFFVVFLMMFMVVIVVSALTYILSSFTLGRIFKKAGQPQWIAWVPFYNNWKMLELGDQAGFWAVLVVVPFVNLASAVFSYIAMYKIGLKLGKDGWFVLVAIFIPIVWLIWLAFDGSKWQPAGLADQPSYRPENPTETNFPTGSPLL